MGDRKNITSWPRPKHQAELFRQTSQTFSLHLTTITKGKGGRVNPYRQNIAPANLKKTYKRIINSFWG